MATVASPTTCYYFADFELDLIRGCLLRADDEVRLRHQSFQLLKYFVEHPGRLIPKDELIAAVWPDTCVTDNALVQCVAEIRRGLNDDPHNPRFIRTISKIGYRFLATVEATGDPYTSVSQQIHGPRLRLQPTQHRPNQETLAGEMSPAAGFRALRLGRFFRPWRLVPISFLTLLLLILHGDKTSDTVLAGRTTSSDCRAAYPGCLPSQE